MKKILFLILLPFIIVSPVYAASIDTYINTTPNIASITDQNSSLVNILTSEISKMISANHLAPALFINGQGNTSPYGTLYWVTPGELISALSRAYPYVSTSIKPQLKTYIDNELSLYPPLTTAYFPPNNGTFSDFTGTRREPFPVNPSQSLNFYPGFPVSISIAYPLWQYTHYTQDRRFIDTASNWNTLKSLYTNFKSTGKVSLYSEVAGLIGFARLAKLKGDVSLANDAIQYVSSAIATTNFSTFDANSRIKLENDWRETYPVFSDGLNSKCCTNVIISIFAPEIGLYLRDNEKAAVQNYSKAIELHDPLWYLTLPSWGGTTGKQNENLYAPLEFNFTNFMIHAYVLEDPFTQLKSYIDFPSRLGDLYFIQELITTIEAASAEAPQTPPPPTITPTMINQSLTPTPVNCPSGNIGNLNCDTNGFIDESDISILIAKWKPYGPVPTPSALNDRIADLNTDTKVDESDLSILLHNWESNPVQPSNSPSPTISPTPNTHFPVYFPIGPGGVDVIPHQLIRTQNDHLYTFVYQGDSSTTLLGYWTINPGIPTSGSNFSGKIQLTESSPIISVETVYDGAQFIHVLINTKSGELKDRPFDTFTNTFKSVKILATGMPTPSTYLVVGTSGVSAQFDTGHTLHLAYWGSGNHIMYTSYTYNANTDTLSPFGPPLQLDGTQSSNNNHPVLAVSPKDNSITVAWISGQNGAGSIYTRTKSATGWDTATKVNTTDAWTNSDNGINIDQGPSLLITSDGTKHLTYIENWRITAPYDYGRIHYVSKTGTSWTDQYIGSYSHDPVLGVDTSGQLTIIGHGYMLNSSCKSANQFCFIYKSGNTWGAPQILTPDGDFDTSPSVKWSPIGWNRPELIEFLFSAAGGYTNPTLYYAHL